MEEQIKKTEYPTKFERIDDRTDRLRVPFGWIVRTMYGGVSVHTIFIGDFNHIWTLEK